MPPYLAFALLNVEQSVCGSTIYVAPEVVDPRKPGYDHCADSFSAGVIMFTMYAPLPTLDHELTGDFQASTLHSLE